MYFPFILILRMQKKFCKDEIFGGSDPSSRQDSSAFKIMCCGGIKTSLWWQWGPMGKEQYYCTKRNSFVIISNIICLIELF